MLRIVQDGLLRTPELCLLAEDATRVGLRFEPRKVAARHVQPDPMPALNRLLVAPMSIVISVGSPGVSICGVVLLLR